MDKTYKKSGSFSKDSQFSRNASSKDQKFFNGPKFSKGSRVDSQKIPSHFSKSYPKQKSKPLEDWVFGWHSCLAALKNPERAAPDRVLLTEARAQQLFSISDQFAKLPIEIVTAAEITRALSQGAVHQGIACKMQPYEPADLEALKLAEKGPLLLLDQVMDPQNVGAILRSAAAFGAGGVILQSRHAPPLSGGLAKAAAGALEEVPCAQVVNLARAIDDLKASSWRIVGLDTQGGIPLDQAFDEAPTVLVLGSEAKGLRRLIAEKCDVLAHIPMPGHFESLNVTAAAAIALYLATKAR